MAARPEPEFGPSGCGQCGFPHGRHWFGHSHDFVQPTDAQILARMLNRRALRDTPDLLMLPPIGATRLGHVLTPCELSSKSAARRARTTPIRWYCRECGRYCGRSGGTEYGAAAIHPCNSYDAEGNPL
jgi:hypothetical protein